MKRRLIFAFAIFLFSGSSVAVFGQKTDKEVRNLKVYYEKGMFGGWPANFGIWNWGDEILVGFAKGYYKDLGSEKHNIDRQKAEVHLLARSLDGGETWKIEDPGKNDKGALFIPNKGSYHGIERTDAKIQKPVACKGINFENPNLAFTLRMSNTDGGESRYWYSYDRGHHWKKPSILPYFNTLGTAARTDYIVEGKSACTLFVSVAKIDGKEGRVMCVKTTDGGKHWNFVSWVGPEPKEGYSIMPASVRISKDEVFVAVRNNTFISAYLSSDNCKSWERLINPVEDTGEGNPPAVVKLKDGRICLLYGSRKKPFSICARLSSDMGRSWSNVIVLRADGSGRDMGYPRAVQRPDGKVVVVYYFQDKNTGPERYIGCTIWTPPAI